MGVDLYWLEEDLDRENDSLAVKTLHEIMEVLSDDKPFKQSRITRLVDEYKKKERKI